MSQAPRPHIFVATHHKSGTVWMLSTFRRIAKANNFAFIHLNTGESGWNIRPDKLDYFEQQRTIAESDSDRPAIFVDYHSAIPDLASCKASRGAKGLHLIRDPRDMLLSAVRYHLVSDEPWLHQPNPTFAGQTFQQKLASYSTLEDRILFEIDHHMGQAIREMHAFDRQEVFRDVKYEDLIVDHTMILFRQLMIHLNLAGQHLTNAIEAFWASSIFGDRSEHNLKATQNHIFNSRPKQWEQLLPLKSLEQIESTFKHEILELGYELSSSVVLNGDVLP